ncbi:MAG TPA: right-handed parallel beta-helix repeat-containing protein [Pyrinomonadaceae bacterium]|jgi:hypothetical protein|nr:right-handed parallel beta-helix repeat-containing protein [Pyrinomonadaceae bacterium]
MNKFRLTINILAIAIFTLAVASMTQAQASRTWVSGVGDDANPCSRTAPCKTFAGAISKTALGGEIDALDPAGYGAVTITKSITIDGGGGQVASVLVAGTNGIVVQAGATDVIILRNLRINGIKQAGNAGINGIRFLAGKSLSVENCFIFGFSTNGIDVALGATGSLVFVTDTVVEDCNGDGLSAQTTSGTVAVTVRRSSFAKNGVGMHGRNNSRMYADSCTFSNNTNQGVFADGSGGQAGVTDIANSSIFNNGTAGVQAQTNGSIARVSNNDVHNNNGTGALVGSGGVIDTFQNNRIFNNGVDGCPSCTPHVANN